MLESLSTDFEYTDERGKLVQLIHSGYEQVNVLTSKAGVLRGRHYHKESKEAFYVISGKVEVEVELGNSYEKKNFEEGDFFLIRPYTTHSLFFPADTILIVLYDQCIEKVQGEKDIYVC